jgi:hypothetical protein
MKEVCISLARYLASDFTSELLCLTSRFLLLASGFLTGLLDAGVADKSLKSSVSHILCNSLFI